MKATSPYSGSRRTLLLAGAIAATLPVLQGCFPLAATGAVAGAALIADRRTPGAYVEDEGIEWTARSRLRERFGNSANIGVTSYNRNVLLTGQVADEQTREEATNIVSGVPNVQGIINELQIAGLSSLSTRSNDAMITSMIKARFVDDDRFHANHVKVVTEAGTAYLLGIVTREEADAASEIASTTNNVQKVVRVFEYVSEEEAGRIARRRAERQQD